MLKLILLIFPLICAGTDLKPWFGNDYEAEFRATILYQNYSSLATPDKNYKRNDNDTFSTLSAAYPFKRYSGEFEATAAHTKHQSCCWDNYRFTGRYKWFDDIRDQFSLVTSITIQEPMTRALNDVSSFHHGHLEGEFCLSYGKKYGYPCSSDYIYRWWNVLGVGSADQGSLWYRAEGTWECNIWDIHRFRVFGHILWGAGGNDLNPYDFHGYGSIRHRSADVGVRYEYRIPGWGSLNFQYAHRVYASNFPQQTNLLMFQYYYPFGSQVHTNY